MVGDDIASGLCPRANPGGALGHVVLGIKLEVLCTRQELQLFESSSILQYVCFPTYCPLQLFLSVVTFISSSHPSVI